MAEELGISKQAVISMIDRLIEKCWILKHPETKFLRPTESWEKVYFSSNESDNQESLPSDKKLDRIGKESLPPIGQETLPHGGQETLPYNSIIDSSKKDSSKNSGGEEEIFEPPKPPLTNSPLGLMTKIWQHHFPSYVFVVKNDNVALREISEILFKKQPSLVDEQTLKNGFSDFCKKVKAHSFYCNTSLGTIKNKIQDILMQSNNPSNGSLKKAELDTGVSQDEYAQYAQKIKA
jgi:hypothetical protein